MTYVYISYTVPINIYPNKASIEVKIVILLNWCQHNIYYVSYIQLNKYYFLRCIIQVSTSTSSLVYTTII